MPAEIPPHALEQPAPRFDVRRIETPAYVVDLGLLRQNLEKLAMVQREAGCKVLLALKGFSMFSTFGLVRQYLSGCCASGIHEAQLAHEEFGKEVHVYAPAFKEEEMRQIIPIADHVSFNSLRQWRTFRPLIEAAKARRTSDSDAECARESQDEGSSSGGSSVITRDPLPEMKSTDLWPRHARFVP